VPESRGRELLNFIADKGLQDVSISREKNKLSWGVPVPGDDSQVMYVWFDALTNYLTGCGTVDGQGIIRMGEQWPADLHIVGKDIARFHGILWTGMLLSARLSLPAKLLVHGFLNVDGQKMSKSIGNVVDPRKTVAEFGSDATRWYLLHDVPTLGDADYTDERMAQVYQSDLANDFGNLVSRVWTMCQKYTEGLVPERGVVPGEEEGVVSAAWDAYHAGVSKCQIQEALHAAHQLMVYCNRRIEEHKPWAMAKNSDQKSELDSLLYGLLEIVRHYTAMIQPAVPSVASRVAAELFPQTPAALLENQAEARQWGGLRAGDTLGSEQLILFPRRDG
jgi:methionyl-tRNA synthetase